MFYLEEPVSAGIAGEGVWVRLVRVGGAARSEGEEWAQVQIARQRGGERQEGDAIQVWLGELAEPRGAYLWVRRSELKSREEGQQLLEQWDLEQHKEEEDKRKEATEKRGRQEEPTSARKRRSREARRGREAQEAGGASGTEGEDRGVKRQGVVGQREEGRGQTKRQKSKEAKGLKRKAKEEPEEGESAKRTKTNRTTSEKKRAGEMEFEPGD